MAQNLDPDAISVCNNSIWAIGEIAMKMGEGMRPHVLGLLSALIIVMNREKGPKTLLENTGKDFSFDFGNYLVFGLNFIPAIFSSSPIFHMKY